MAGILAGTWILQCLRHKLTILFAFCVLIILIFSLNHISERSFSLNHISERHLFSADSNLLKHDLWRDSKHLCFDGHVTNMAPVCGAGICLSVLTGPRRVTPRKLHKNTSHIPRMKGWMNPVHIDVVRVLSEMQWQNGIYGSVGEIGVYMGKYTSVLALNTATEAGEKLFVCDTFGNPSHMKLKTEKGNKDYFAQNLAKFGFSFDSEDLSRQIYSWNDSSVYLSKYVYHKMGLNAFRFYSIDGNHHAPYVLTDLRHVTCVLRQGGIISMDDVVNRKWPGVLESLKAFFIMYGENIIVPLLMLYSKAYMCTYDEYDEYMEYLRQEKYIGQIKICETTSSYFGPSYTYFVEC